MKKLLLQIAAIIIISTILGLSVNYPVIKRYLNGEFQHGFLDSEDYPAITFIPLEEAEALFSSQEALFIDSRSEENFKAGHIPGAINIAFDENTKENLTPLESIPIERNLVIYCDGSECQSSVELAKILDRRGFQNIKVFFGGWAAWINAGLPISSENDSQ